LLSKCREGEYFVDDYVKVVLDLFEREKGSKALKKEQLSDDYTSLAKGSSTLATPLTTEGGFNVKAIVPILKETYI